MRWAGGFAALRYSYFMPRKETLKTAPQRPRGRPVKYPMPPPLPDTAENIVRALVKSPPKTESEWDYLRVREPRRRPAT